MRRSEMGPVGAMLTWLILLYTLWLSAGWKAVVLIFATAGSLVATVRLVLPYLDTRAARQRAVAPCNHGYPGALANPRACPACSANFDRLERERVEADRVRAQQKEAARIAQAEERRQLEWWSALDGRQFEVEVANLLTLMGHKVVLTSYTADKGVDIIISSEQGKTFVQCKAHRKPIGPGTVRDLWGTMHDGGAMEGWIVSTSGYSIGARMFAQEKPISLLTINDLLTLASSKGIVPTAPPNNWRRRTSPPRM